MWLMDRAIGRSTEKGSRQFIWAALGPDGKDGAHVRHIMNGAYVSLAAVVEPSDFAMSKEGYEAQEKIWVSPSRVRRVTSPLIRFHD